MGYAAAICVIEAEGIKVQNFWSFNGAEMARSESYKDGRIPLFNVFRVDIDYAFRRRHILLMEDWYKSVDHER